MIATNCATRSAAMVWIGILVVDLKFLWRLGLIVDLADRCRVFTSVFIVAVIIFRTANGLIDDSFRRHARHIDS